MNNYIFIFFSHLILGIGPSLYGATFDNVDSARLQECINGVTEINSSILNKAYLCWDSSRDWWLSTQNDNTLKVGSNRFLDEFAIYQDSHGNIRKVIFTDYQYEYDVRIFYYDTSGILIYAVFDLGGGEDSWNGYQYSDKSGVVLSNIQHIDNMEFREEPLIKDIYKYGGQVLNIGTWDLDKFRSVDKFKSYYKIGGFPAGCSKVTFTYEVDSGKTIINRNNVVIRAAEGSNSSIAKVVNAGRDITIISQGKKEYLSPWGDFFWYKIKYERFFTNDQIGYVFGAFIEPIEKLITD